MGKIVSHLLVDISIIDVLHVKTSENTSHCVNEWPQTDHGLQSYTRVGFLRESIAAANSMQVSYALPEVYSTQLRHSPDGKAEMRDSGSPISFSLSS
jgi:hypothetical protein